MLELRAEEVVSCVEGSAEKIEGSAVGPGDAVVPTDDTEVETERAFVDRVSGKLLGTVAI